MRKEIATLQDALLLSEDEKAEFGAFIDDEYTEELLSAHEAEAERLRAEVESAGVHLSRVKEWMALKADEEELERSAADPNRFKKRGTAMLQEERMRKRVEKRKPKVSERRGAEAGGRQGGELIPGRGRASCKPPRMGGRTRAAILSSRGPRCRHDRGRIGGEGGSKGGQEGE